MDSVRVLYFLFFIFCFVFYVLYFVFCILYKHVIHDIQRTRASYPCQPTAEMGHFVFGIFDWDRGGWVIFWHQHLNWGSILCRSEHLYHRIFDWDKGRVEGRRVISWHQHLNCAGTSANPISESLLTLSYVVRVNWCLAIGHYSFKGVEEGRIIFWHQHLKCALYIFPGCCSK